MPTAVTRAAVFALELLIVTIAVFAGAWMASTIEIIPKSLIHLPTIRFSPADTRVVLVTALVGCAAAFLFARAVAGWSVFATARRAATEVYALVAGIVAAALYQFFLTAVNFSPELLLDTTLIAIAGFLLAFLAFGPVGTSLARRFSGFFANLFSLLAKPATWAVVLFALSPIVVGRAFTQDRDFANWVTRLRVNANVSSDQPFTLVNAMGAATFTTPIMVQFARGDPRTAYVLTRSGELWRADYPTGANVRLLMNIAPRVGYVEMENGALGFDLHPEFGRAGSPNAGYAYIYYTEYRADGQTNHLTRFDLSAATPQARTATATSLIEQGRNNDGYHNAGMVQFGPDNMLYLAVGEASMNECHQRIDCALVGGILRIDVDQAGGAISRPIARQPLRGRSANYFIPLDNPYAGRGAAALGEYWAHGMRNPFRFGFDPANGQMWAGEVGSTVWEEVNRVEKGGNYRFPYMEGRTPQPRFPKPAQVEGVEQDPVLTYRHTAFLRSVIGGTVYRATRHRALQGKYVFADNYSGEVMTIPADARRADTWEVVARARDVAQRGLTAMVVAPDGEMLIPVMGDNDKPTGIIAKLVPADSEAGRAATQADEMRIAATRPPAGGTAATLVSGVPLAQARTLYNVNCARCHGAQGLGNGPDSQDLGAWVPNFQDANFHKWRSDAEIVAVLKGGGAAVGQSETMPPWADILSEAEIVGVKDYVRSFRAVNKPE